MSTGFIYDERFLRHDTGPGHAERPDRLRAIVARIRGSELWDRLHHLEARPAGRSAIERAHTPAYVASVERACLEGIRELDADTTISAESYRIALLAAGSVLVACDAVMAGECDNAFCAIRPPGHHAERDYAMGFCLFGNVAVAARHLQDRHGLERIAILDWDVHHGNGTQHIFEEDPTVLYVSLHQSPLYPGTGESDERGVGAGEGFTVNFPMPPGCGDAEYATVFERAAERIAEFSPDFILVSAGFDAHRRDPLANMRMTEQGFRAMTRRMLDLAGEQCRGRLVLVLEGGYDLEGLSASVEACLEELIGAA